MIYYGEETKKAMENFRLESHATSPDLICAMVQVKEAAAMTWAELLPEKKDIYEAVIQACRRIQKGGFEDQFVTEALQGGAGTSAHMNVNEVLAGMAGEILGKPAHPLDDVNRGQSTNDVYPTALRIAVIRHLRVLSDACAHLQESLQKKENEFCEIEKLGRTEMMDAVPITLGEEFGAYAQAIARDRWRIYKIEERVRQVNLGGTAVGGGDNTCHRYQALVLENLRELTGMGLARAEYPMDITQNNDVFVEVSGLLKALAVNLLKIAGDFRLMNSGPGGGLGEIRLKKLQKGSTIMPGKVNPVACEMIMQVSMRVIANDCAVTEAASRGDFELNAFFPLIADSMLESLKLLENGIELFRTRCVDVLEADADRCREHLNRSAAFGTSYTQKLGYDRVSELTTKYGRDPEKLCEILEKEITVKTGAPDF